MKCRFVCETQDKTYHEHANIIKDTKIEKYIYPTYLDAETRPNRARAAVQRELVTSLAFQAEVGHDCGAGDEGFRIHDHVVLGRFSKSPP